MDIQIIKQKVHRGEFEISEHAEEERTEDGITISDIKEAISNARILENYPEHPRGACCLILGYTGGGCPLHIVCAILPEGRVRIVTVYIPGFPKWTDPEARAKKGE